MTVSTTPSNLGRHVFGLAVLACGIVALVFRGSVFIYAVAAAQIIGGVAIQFDRTAKVGAIIIGVVYLVLSIFSVPQIVTHPQIYASWGNFFYPFSVVIGAAVVVARSTPAWNPQTVARVASILLGVCAASFGIEQVEFLGRTASLVPKWIPPSQMFWAITTCVPFALAAVALVTNRYTLPATRLFALMMFLFGALVWIPILFSDPRSHGNWIEGTETVAIGGTAWILADFLTLVRRQTLSPRAASTSRPSL